MLQRVATMMHAPEVSESPFLYNEKPEAGPPAGNPAKRRRKTPSSDDGAMLKRAKAAWPEAKGRPAK